MIARVLIGSEKERAEEINKSLALHLEGGELNHPDVLHFPADSKLGIEQAKQIIEFLSLKPYQVKGRIVILEDASNLTHEAQNALLKTLEEPPEEAILILGASSDANFLPTILSRCEIVILKHSIDLVGRRHATYEVYVKDIERLISQDMADRFEYIEKLKDQKTKEEFLHTLVQYFHQSLAHTGSGNVNFLNELLQAEEWAASNVNLRGILEYLMLVMPNKNL